MTKDLTERLKAVRDEVFQDDAGLWVRDPLGNCRPFDINDYESLSADLTEAASLIQRLEGELAASTKRADNHWETLRSIREMAREGDCDRIVLWVNDAGSGHTETAAESLKAAIDRALAAEQALSASQKEVERLTGAAQRLLTAAKLLQANSEGCAVNHYGEDFGLHGVPGFLIDTQADILAMEAALQTGGKEHG